MLMASLVRSSIVFLTASFCYSLAFAAEPASSVACATAEIIEGNTCSKVKVKFNFDKCPTKSASRVISKVSCVGHTVTAVAIEHSVRYEAKFLRKFSPASPAKQSAAVTNTAAVQPSPAETVTWLPVGPVVVAPKTAAKSAPVQPATNARVPSQVVTAAVTAPTGKKMTTPTPSPTPTPAAKATH